MDLKQWRQLAFDLAVVDGRLSEPAAALIKRALLADGQVSWGEVEFLVMLKRAAASMPAPFDEFVYEVMKRVVLRNGNINPAETGWLRQTIFADKKVSARELQFLEQVRQEAQAVCPEFEALYEDCKSSPEFSRT